MTTASPPRWAEELLRTILGREHGETVAGDLIEQYRDSVYPSRGQSRADWWFIREVGGFVWRATWVWAAVFAALWLGRAGLDWFVPTTDFRMRSMILTYSAISLFTALGCWRAWRTRSLRGSALAALITALLAAVFKTIGTGLMFAIWHDAETRVAIAGSGGLGECFELPWLVILPATVFAIAGGLIGKAAATLFRPEVSRQ